MGGRLNLGIDVCVQNGIHFVQRVLTGFLGHLVICHHLRLLVHSTYLNQHSNMGQGREAQRLADNQGWWKA